MTLIISGNIFAKLFWEELKSSFSLQKDCHMNISIQYMFILGICQQSESAESGNITKYVFARTYVSYVQIV